MMNPTDRRWPLWISASFVGCQEATMSDPSNLTPQTVAMLRNLDAALTEARGAAAQARADAARAVHGGRAGRRAGAPPRGRVQGA